MRHLVVDVVVASALKQTQGGGSDVELGDLVLLDDVPVAGEVGVGGGALEDDGCATQHQGSVDDVCVTGNPADVTATEEAVVVVDVKDVLAGHGSTEQVTGSGVHDTLGLAGRTGSVEQKQRVFGANGLGSNVVRVLLDLLVPPDVTARGPGNLGTGALVDQNAGDLGALLESLVDDALSANGLTTTTTLIGGDDDLGASIHHTIPQGVRGETGKDDGVDGTDTGAGKEGNESFGNHGKVDGDGVTLLDTLLLESPGDTGNLTEQLPVGNNTALIGLVGLVDDGNLVGVLDRVTVDTVERSIQTTLDKPGHIAIDEGAVAGSLEIPVEGEEFAGHAGPEGVGIPDGLLV